MRAALSAGVRGFCLVTDPETPLALVVYGVAIDEMMIDCVVGKSDA